MENRPLILITNDDGIQSPGLRAAAEAVVDLGDLLIVAPSTQQTGAGRSYISQADKTIHSSYIVLNGRDHVAYSANVSPAQAANLGSTQLAGRPVDLCISGINFGENIGSGVTISGTVGAALEAACNNIPALAVSLETLQEFHLNHSNAVDFTVAAHFTRYFARQVLSKGLPNQVDLLKIDVPACATPQTGWRMARVSRQRYYHAVPTHQLNQSSSAFSYRALVDPDTLEPDSDIYVFAIDKEIPVVPMSIDLTAPVALTNVGHYYE